ncbi:MAG TPA: aconitate hydratase [Bacillota bacterium]
MGRSLTRQILESRRVEGEWTPGGTLAVKVDQVLTHDALGALVFLQFAALGLERVRVPVAVAYADHNVFQVDARMSRDHRFIRTAARKFGAYYSPPGAGICHEVHLQRFAAPGGILLGSDSHTPTAGGLGMVAVGAGGLDVTMALAGGTYRLQVPRVTEVRLEGRLQPWATAKDVILALLARLTVKGGRGRIFEFTGPGVAGLSVPQRATIANMCTELGATSGVFPSDAQTRSYLKAMGRGDDWRPLEPEPGAGYDEVIELDLGEVEPLAACPGMPDRVRPVREIAGIAVDQVLVGSCTNGSYTDLRQVADVLRDRRVHPDVEFVVNPASRSATRWLAREGRLEPLLAAGVSLSEATCGPCIGLVHVPRPGGVSLRTFNRNFFGRSGLKEDQVYLVSPLVAAASGVAGRLVDPRDWAAEQAAAGAPVEAPPVVVAAADGIGVDDLIPPAPAEEADRVELAVTGDMQALPPLDPFPAEFAAPVVGVFGDDITTDDIVPASGEALALMTHVAAMARFTFARVDPGFVGRAEEAGAGVIVAGHNYGQGSSRENAAMAVRQLGIRVILARSFARIHRANLLNWGILPLILDPDAEAPGLGDRLDFPHLRDWLLEAGPGAPFTIRNVTHGGTVTVRHDLSRRELHMVLAGGLFPRLREQAGGAGEHVNEYDNEPDNEPDNPEEAR